jgi:hypothetical protein
MYRRAGGPPVTRFSLLAPFRSHGGPRSCPDRLQ